MVTVCTVLPPPERPRIDAAGDGCFDTLHADSLREAIYVARRQRVDAMVISVHRCHGEALPGVARFVREFPAIPAVALVSRHAPALSTVRGLARHLRVRPSTLMSRFHRAGIPSPKSYLAGMRLLHASFLFQNPGLSVSDVAYRMDYSSPQSFGRHLRAVLGVTAGEFRRRFPFEVALARYIDLLIIPYREALRAFHPFNAGSWDQGPSAAAVSRSASAFRV